MYLEKQERRLRYLDQLESANSCLVLGYALCDPLIAQWSLVEYSMCSFISFLAYISKNLIPRAQGYSVHRVSLNTVGFEHVLAARARIGDVGSGNLVLAQIEAVGHDNLIDLAPRQRANLNQIGINFVAFRKDKCAAVRSTFGQREWRWYDVHFAVAHEDVAVAAEAPETLVLVNVGVVGIQKATMTQNQVEHGITIAVRVRRVAPEHVIDLPPVVLAARHLRIAVVVNLAARIGQPLDFETFGELHEPEVWV